MPISQRMVQPQNQATLMHHQIFHAHIRKVVISIYPYEIMIKSSHLGLWLTIIVLNTTLVIHIITNNSSNGCDRKRTQCDMWFSIALNRCTHPNYIKFTNNCDRCGHILKLLIIKIFGHRYIANCCYTKVNYVCT